MPPAAISAAVIWAVSWVALTNVVVRLLPLKRTMELMVKFVPVAVSVKAALPADLLVGLILLNVGDGLLTAKLTALDVPPPGVGFKTVIAKVPPAAISAAVICAVNWVLLTKVVVRLLPLKRTTELLLKLVPVAVSVNAAVPAVLVVGLMLLSVGDGLVTVKFTALEVPPPGDGFKTVIGKVPPTATSANVICAVNSVLPPKLVVRLLPLNLTIAPSTKPVPVTVSVKAASPAVLLDGLILLTVGAGLLTEKVRGLDVPPPGVGLVTVTEIVPTVSISEADICAVNSVASTTVAL